MCVRVRFDRRSRARGYIERITGHTIDPPRGTEFAPTDPLFAIIFRDGALQCEQFSWGFVPSGEPTLRGQRHCNARAETVTQLPAFRAAMEKRRCVVPVDAFFEWSGPKNGKTKWEIGMTDETRPVLLAGLYERFERDGASLDTCTVLTCEPNELMAPIHNRMPLVLAAANVDRWLDPAVNAAGVADLLRPSPAEEMRAEAVERPEQLDFSEIR